MKDHQTTEKRGATSEVSGRYKVLGLLGQGSFGTVVAGLNHETGKNLAITRIHPVAGSISGARHILREITTMRVLQHHPNIINLEDIWVNSNSNTLYIVLELMECNLERIFSSGHVLTAVHTKVLVKQLLLGVQAMHRHGILHRDLTPANLLLLSDCQLRITEFGRSRRLKPHSLQDGKEKIADGAVDDGINLVACTSTSCYQAPEVMLGPEGSCGEPVDVWSVGCIFGEMLGSRGALFPGESYADQVRQILAAVGEPGYIEGNGVLGYELREDVLEFLGTLKPPSGPLLESLVPRKVDEEAVDLLKHLLDMNTRHRLTAPQALGHAFFRGSLQLPTAAAASTKHGAANDNSIGTGDQRAVNFSWDKDDDLTIEEFEKLIAAEAELHKDTGGRESHQRTGSLEDDAPPSLAPLPQQKALSLQGLLGVIRTQARRQDRENEAAVTGGRAGLGSPSSQPAATAAAAAAAASMSDNNRLSSMANLAEAGYDGDDFGVGGPLASSIDWLDWEAMASEPHPPGTPGGNAEPNEPKPGLAGSSSRAAVNSREDVAATRIQATCRRRAAQKRFLNNNKRGSAGKGIEEEDEEEDEEERAASLIQKTHRRAAAIRRARAEQERCFQNQQFSFGPGFQQQQPVRRTTRDRGDTGTEGSSKGSSEGQNRGVRGEPSLTPSEEEDERQKKSSTNRAAAIKIQTQARLKAASRRVDAARQRRAVTARKEAAMAAAVASVPRLPIGSSTPLPSSGGGGGGGGRIAPKVQREPLAILRQLRGDEAEVHPKHKTDQFMLRMTIKSAIAAHIKKTGAARRKPRPLPAMPSWSQGVAAMKLRSSQQQQQQQQQAGMTSMPLTKPRAISPLHRSVRQVNRFMAAADGRRGGQPWTAAAGPRGRPRSAPPTTATGRLRCAIFAAEVVVEREYERAEKQRKYCGGGSNNAPVDASPLFVPYQQRSAA